MTSLERALELSVGLETSPEDLDKIFTRGDIGLNDISGLRAFDDYDSDEMREYESRLMNYGFGSKYFY